MHQGVEILNPSLKSNAPPEAIVLLWKAYQPLPHVSVCQTFLLLNTVAEELLDLNRGARAHLGCGYVLLL